MNKQSMWAVQYRRYGGPEELGIGTVRRPRPSPTHVLVDVAAFSVNTIDLLARRGKMRGLNGFGFPKGTGVDFSGTVAETGAALTNLTVGDRVWGYLGMKPPGTHAAAAEFLTVPAANTAVAPNNIALEDAAALPLVGLTALQALRGALKVSHGDRVLIVGGSGGVGTAAIQIAAALGARVDAVAGARGDAARQVGAMQVYDYRSGTPDEITDRYDAVLGATSAPLRSYRRLVAPGGRIAALNPSAIPAILTSVLTPGPVVCMVSAGPSADDLAWLTQAVDTGAVRPVVNERYPLHRISDAHGDAETNPAGGKRIVVARRACL